MGSVKPLKCRGLKRFLFLFAYAIDYIYCIVYSDGNERIGGDCLKLKEAREKVELTQEELVKKADVSIGTIRKIEQRGHVPSKRIKKKLAKALKIAVNELED